MAVKKVLQVITGKIPEHLIRFVKSVNDYAKKIDAEYVVLSGNDTGNYLINRSESDKIRCDYLSKNPFTLYCDWDILLCNNFTIYNYELPMFYYKPKECMIYNGNNTEMFKEIYSMLPSVMIPDGHHLLRAITKYLYDNQLTFDEFENAAHYCNAKGVF